MNRSNDVVFLSGRRTAMGTFGGSLKQFTANDLGAFASRAALQSSGVEASDIDEVIFGNALQTSSDAIYMARHVGLKAGVPIEKPALTLNRLCGSGFQAIISGAQQIMLGESKVVLAGGAESMSQAPHVVRGSRWGDLRLGPPGDYFEDLLWSALTDTQCNLSMAQTAEKLAEQYGIKREQADDVAYSSQQRAKAAWDAGRFDSEVVGVKIKSRKGEVQFRADEHMRPDTTREALAGLKPYFKKDGLVTAGNASGIGDGAAAVVVASESWAREYGRKPIGRLISWGIAGVDPSIMGIGPAPASRRALERAGLTIDQMDLVEVNEAFAGQFCA